MESQALYNILENDVIPCFYERRNGDAPNRWIKMMKESMKMAMHDFCAQCMVKRYESLFYVTAAAQYRRLMSEGAKDAQALNAQRRRLADCWSAIRIEPPERTQEGPFRVGDTIVVNSLVHLGDLKPEEVEVELYYGTMKSVETLVNSKTQLMSVKEDRGNGTYLYACDIVCNTSGRFGFTARVTPRGDQLIKFTPGFITWA